MSVPVPPALLRDPGHLLSLGFGAGLAPWAPGTFGTLVGLAPVLVLWWLEAPWTAMVALAALVTALGVVCSARTARELGVHDHGAIVVDEIAGIIITLIAVPPSWLALAVGFGLFRLFDITKPWPIGVVDARVTGGVGIMADDVLAGLLALGCLHGLLALGWLPIG